MQNTSKIIFVHFPNGQTRSRNVDHTITPENRAKVAPRFPATADVYSRRAKFLKTQNTFKQIVEEETQRAAYMRAVCEVVILICVVMLYILIRAYCAAN